MSSSSEVNSLLTAYENRAKALLVRLGQLAQHLRQVLADPLHAHPDWPTIVTHFRVTETQLEQLHRDVQPFLQYFVLRPASRPATRPPLHADIPLMLSTRSYLDMEEGEGRLQAAYWAKEEEREVAEEEEEDEEEEEEEEGAGGRRRVDKVIARANEAVERVGIVCDWQLAEFKAEMRAQKRRDEEKVKAMAQEGWRKEGGEKAEEAFAWLEARTDGRPVPVVGRR